VVDIIMIYLVVIHSLNLLIVEMDGEKQ